MKEKIEVSIKRIENIFFVSGKVKNENVFVAIVETEYKNWAEKLHL